jgi:hypothetical protein
MADPRDEMLREMAKHRGLRLIRSRRRKPGGDFGRKGHTDIKTGLLRRRQGRARGQRRGDRGLSARRRQSGLEAVAQIRRRRREGRRAEAAPPR